MSRIELGSKCVCVGCDARFYDLNRAPAVCPKCAVTQPPPVPRSARPVRLPAARRPFQRQGPAVEEEFVEPVSRVEDEDDGLLIDPDADADAEAASEEEEADLVPK